MNKKNRLTISIVAAIILLACACPGTSLPVINDQPTIEVPTIQFDIPSIAPPEQSATVVLSDDFSVTSSEFESFSDASGSGETKDGVFVVRSISDLWNWAQSSTEINDMVTEFDATMITGPGNNNAGFGLICRMKTRDDGSVDGYLLAISGDGFYSIRSIASSSMSPLVDWTSSDAVNQGNETNELRVTCKGSELKLEVNGEVVATASTNSGGPESGAIAFAVVSFETAEPVAEVHFDNLVVSAP